MSALAAGRILSLRDSSTRKLGSGLTFPGRFLFARNFAGIESRNARPSLDTQPLDHAFHNLTDRLPRHLRSPLSCPTTKAREAMNAVQENPEAGSSHDH